VLVPFVIDGVWWQVLETLGVSCFDYCIRWAPKSLPGIYLQRSYNERAQWGASLILLSSDCDAEQRIFEVTQGDGVAVAFETAGQSATVEVCIRTTAFGGRVVLVGHSRQVSNIYGSDIVFKELDIVGSRNSLGQFPKAIKMLTTEPLTWQSMISHRFSFDQSVEAFVLGSYENPPPSKIVIDLLD